jgi:hypothetical protein
VMCAITSLPASADTVTRKVRFKRDVAVGGTLVKAGTYKVVFDDATGELSIVKGGKTVAKAPARLEKIEGRVGAYGDYIVLGENALSSVTLKSGNRAVVGGGTDSAEREQ